MMGEDKLVLRAELHCAHKYKPAAATIQKMFQLYNSKYKIGQHPRLAAPAAASIHNTYADVSKYCKCNVGQHPRLAGPAAASIHNEYNVDHHPRLAGPAAANRYNEHNVGQNPRLVGPNLIFDYGVFSLFFTRVWNYFFSFFLILNIKNIEFFNSTP